MAVAAEPIAADFGLSNRQKAQAGAKGLGGLLPKPKTSHPYIVGLILVTIGFVGIVGSITGQLPAMFGALFDPNALVDKTGGTPGITVVPAKDKSGNEDESKAEVETNPPEPPTEPPPVEPPPIAIG